MGLAEGTMGVRFPNAVRVLRLDLLGLGLLADTGGLGLLGLPRMHTTVTRTRQSTITAGGTLTSHTLTGRLAGGLQLGELGSQGRTFSKEGIHWGGRVLEG